MKIRLMAIRSIVKLVLLNLVATVSLLGTAAHAELPAPTVQVVDKYDIKISWRKRGASESYLYQNGVVIEELDGRSRGVTLHDLAPGTYQYYFEMCYEEIIETHCDEDEEECDENEETICENSYPASATIWPNQAPTMSMVTRTGSQYSHTERITLEASAMDSDGSISAVRFYKNNVDLGSTVRSGSTYRKTLGPQAPGTYTIKAIATDDEGLTRQASIHIEVYKTTRFTDTVTYHHTDMLGSPVVETNAAGAVTRRSNYEPFGKRIEGDKAGIGYTGHLEDADLGLTYMQARLYDPMIGRFYSNDPVDFLGHIQRGNVQGFNRYAYANNNPYKYIDPDGQAPQSADDYKALAGGIIDVAVGAVEMTAGGVTFLTGAAGVVALEPVTTAVGLLGMAGGAYMLGDGSRTMENGTAQIIEGWTGEEIKKLPDFSTEIAEAISGSGVKGAPEVGKAAGDVLKIVSKSKHVPKTVATEAIDKAAKVKSMYDSLQKIKEQSNEGL